MTDTTIWKMPDMKPEYNRPIIGQYSDGRFVISTILREPREWEREFVKWTYLNDLITESQKATEYKKALDIALDDLQMIAEHDAGFRYAHHPLALSYGGRFAEQTINKITTILDNHKDEK
jgi:hypothetical protein